MCLLLERKFFRKFPNGKWQQKPKSCGIYKHGESQEDFIFNVFGKIHIYHISYIS